MPDFESAAGGMRRWQREPELPGPAGESPGRNAAGQTGRPRTVTTHSRIVPPPACRSNGGPNLAAEADVHRLAGAPDRAAASLRAALRISDDSRAVRRR